MADIRIKDLTTTASSSASDDFIAVDGTTNGTRKLNAYSPSFGGNATVGGTLTVNGAGTSSVAGNFGIGTTSPGARLDVAGGDLYVRTSYRVLSDTFANYSGSGIPLTIGTGGLQDIVFKTNSTEFARLTSAGNLLINSTTASTSTSTGALVVSGGVGVAGAINVGGDIKIGEDAQITNSSTVASGTRLTLNTKAQQGIDIYRSDSNANYSGIRFRNSANTATNAEIGWSGTTLRVDAATVEITGAISIGNTVNTVSPTSPNRTITMVIGGTTYYLHAKTTND